MLARMSARARWLSFVLLAACAPAAVEQVGPRAAVTAISDAGNDTAASQYVLKVPPRTQPGRSFDLEGGKRGVLLGTRRAVIGARGGTPLLVEDEVAIRQVVALPEPDGFLFFTPLGVSRAKGFADPLEPLAVGSIDDVQIGPGFVLVR